MNRAYWLYNIVKFYKNVASQEIGWITATLASVMSIVYLTEKLFGVVIEGVGVLYVGVAFSVLLIAGGFLIKKSGLYDSDQLVNMEQNPVSKEVYDAAKKINNGLLWDAYLDPKVIEKMRKESNKIRWKQMRLK